MGGRGNCFRHPLGSRTGIRGIAHDRPRPDARFGEQAADERAAASVRLPQVRGEVQTDAVNEIILQRLREELANSQRVVEEGSGLIVLRRTEPRFRLVEECNRIRPFLGDEHRIEQPIAARNGVGVVGLPAGAEIEIGLFANADLAANEVAGVEPAAAVRMHVGGPEKVAAGPVRFLQLEEQIAGLLELPHLVVEAQASSYSPAFSKAAAAAESSLTLSR